MSAIFEECRLALLLSDFASQDASGKVGLLGAGWSFTGTPTPPQAVVALVEIPGELANEKFSISLVLNDEHGEPVQLPDPITGEPRPLRVAQNAVAVSAPGMPRRAPVTVQVVINLAPGLPLTADRVYTWQASVDGETKTNWAASFYVVEPPAPPVVG